MRARLIGVPGSHPVRSAELMLEFKGIPYTRLDLPNMTHKLLLPLLGFRSATVPVLRIDGRRVTGTRRIARALDALQPEPPLFGADRAVIEGAEAWADGALQDGVRQLGRWGATHDPGAMAAFLDGPLMGIPASVVRRAIPLLRPGVKLQMRIPDETARAGLAALPGQLDHVDALIAEGVIGGERPNAADFQIAPSVRLAMCFEQLHPHIANRPAGMHAVAVCPYFPGRFTAVIPQDWIPF